MTQGASSCPVADLHEERTPQRAPWKPRWELVPEILAGLLVLALLGLAYREAWWSIRLYAPQYPNGLGVEVLLSGARGDVREIDTLNHYIGMASLTTAAPLERKLALVGIGGAALAATLLMLAPWRRANLAAVAVLASIPLGFIADFFYWLHRFGHELNPHAPLRLPPFTPDLFGNGVIGQFMTFARPELGFWLAVGAAVSAAACAALRGRRQEGAGGAA
jgi:hypothetical protein